MYAKAPNSDFKVLKTPLKYSGLTFNELASLYGEIISFMNTSEEKCNQEQIDFDCSLLPESKNYFAKNDAKRRIKEKCCSFCKSAVIPENAVSETSVDESGKKLKRNYCYVCKVQCTAKTNLKQHEKGRKHLKNLGVLKKQQAKKQRRTNLRQFKGSRVAATSSRSLTSSGEDLYASKTYETQGSSSNVFENTAMDNFNRRPTKNKRQEYFNSDYSNQNSRYHEQRSSYSNEYRGGRRNFNRYHSWTNPKFSSTPYRNNDEYGYAQNNPYYSRYNSMHEGFTDDSYSFPNSYTEFNDDSASANNETEDSMNRPENSSHSGENVANRGKRNYDSSLSSSKSANSRTGGSVHRPERSDYNNENFRGKKCSDLNVSSLESANNGTEASAVRPESSSYDRENFGSRRNRYFESPSSESACLPKRRIYYDDPVPSTSNSSVEKLTVVVGSTSNKSSSWREVKAGESAPEKSPVLTKTDIAKLVEKRRVARSRSLSASEGCAGKNQAEHQTDSDGASEEQKIKDWTNSLLDTSSNQISRLINPSNYKEKAAVNQLITKLSRTKRNEILTRTMRSNSLESAENNIDETAIADHSNTLADILISERGEAGSFTNSSKEQSNPEQDNSTSPLIRKSKKNPAKDSDSVVNVAATGSRTAVEEASPLSHNSKKSSRSAEVSGLMETSPEVRQETVPAKRKKSEADSVGTKKQKTSVSRSGVREATVLPEIRESAVENLSNSAVIPQDALQSSSQALPSLKEELIEFTDVNPTATPEVMESQNALNQNLVFNSDFSLESLMQLFASGNVKVKEEFNDPVVDAIKEISPFELMSACSNVGEATNQTTANPRKSLKDKSAPATAVNARDDDRNALNTNVTGLAESVDAVPTERNGQSAESVSSSDKASSSTSSKSAEKDSNESTTENQTKPDLSDLILQLQDITSQEEKIKEKLSEAKAKISEYSALVEEWKNKKRKLQIKEDSLRIKRNEIIKSMQGAVEKNDENSKQLETPSPRPSSSAHQPATSNPPAVESNVREKASPNKLNPSSSVKSPLKQTSLTKQKKKKNESPASTGSDDITILPLPSKPSPPEIIICDDTEDVSVVPRSVKNNTVTTVLSKKGPICNLKNWNAHNTIVNNLVVFEDYLYTCSNDSTAKRFSIKDGSLSVTYIHRFKNVTEVVVEKVQNEAHVFTACSARLLSIFIASSGTKIKSIDSPSTVMSVCKGWGKFYSGLSNGSINVYNWKFEETEIVRTENPVTRLATAHQGRLHVLVILSSEGRISIRDAETGLLIRSCLIQIRHPSWMTLCNDLVYLSTADKELIILDIMSGKIENKMHMTNHSTGLAVYDDYIFTIAYNGVIHCYKKDKMNEKKLFYGAGKSSLTCIHVYNDWVFTGNRKGEVSVFHFDPSTNVICKIHNCNLVYGLKEDLEFHIEKDHLTKKKYLMQCQWHRCYFTFPANSDTTDKMNHFKSHIYAMHLL